MTADLMTAALLLNPLLTFEEVQREVAMMRAVAKRAASEADQTRVARRPVSAVFVRVGRARPHALHSAAAA